MKHCGRSTPQARWVATALLLACSLSLLASVGGAGSNEEPVAACSGVRVGLLQVAKGSEFESAVVACVFTSSCMIVCQLPMHRTTGVRAHPCGPPFSWSKDACMSGVLLLLVSKSPRKGWPGCVLAFFFLPHNACTATDACTTHHACPSRWRNGSGDYRGSPRGSSRSGRCGDPRGCWRRPFVACRFRGTRSVGACCHRWDIFGQCC
jgi:hypothetical protein